PPRPCRRTRGGGGAVFSLDAQPEEERYRLEPADNTTADKLFDRRWAQTVFERVLERLRAEHEARGKIVRFEELQAFLIDDPDAARYGEIAGRLGMTEGAVK